MKQHTFPLALTTIVCRSKIILSSLIGDEAVLMSLECGNYHGLDAIATDVWQRLEQPISIGDLCVQLVEEYEADLTTIQGDVLNLLERLRVERLLDVRDGA
jgi:hypothetical protein